MLLLVFAKLDVIKLVLF